MLEGRQSRASRQAHMQDRAGQAGMSSGHVRQAFQGSAAGRQAGRQGRAGMTEEAVMESRHIRHECKEDKAGRHSRRAEQAITQAEVQCTQAGQGRAGRQG
jgi:hypothetical protein